MPAVRVLVIEDDHDTSRLEKTVLEQAGYQVHVSETGSAGLDAAATFRPDVVILDVGLPDISGLDVCTSLCNSNDAFILMVSGHSREQDVLLGLGLGADDYITKPFSGNELVARVASFLRRRARRGANVETTISIGDLVLDRDHHTLARDGRSVAVTAFQFRLMHFLAESVGRLLTRAQILEHVWHDTSGVPTRAVDVHVAELRKKLVEIDAPFEIVSVRGIGYRLDQK